jgi:hypothetical protein
MLLQQPAAGAVVQPVMHCPLALLLLLLGLWWWLPAASH